MLNRDKILEAKSDNKLGNDAFNSLLPHNSFQEMLVTASIVGISHGLSHLLLFFFFIVVFCFASEHYFQGSLWSCLYFWLSLYKKQVLFTAFYLLPSVYNTVELRSLLLCFFPNVHPWEKGWAYFPLIQGWGL